LSPLDKKFIQFPNTALYSPIAYLGQIPGMSIGVMAKMNPLFTFYLGRLSNLLFFILIVYQAIRIMPFYKLTMALLALMPMTLSLAGALSSDVVVFAFNFLWVALLLRVLYEDKQVCNTEIVTFMLLALVISLSKHYIFLIPLIFLIPKSKFSNSRKCFLCMLGVLLISILSLLSWQSVINNFSFNTSGQANPIAQIGFILHHPFSYLMVMLKTLIVKTPRVIITMVGVPGCLDTRLDFLTYILYPALIILSLFDEKKFLFTKFQSRLILIISIMSTVLISTELYIIWSKPASPLIYALCGRYFIPIVLPFLLVIGNFLNIKLSDSQKRALRILICILLILILISSDLSLIHRFYVLTPNLYYKV
jgi:uncharacterized membrane protein